MRKGIFWCTNFDSECPELITVSVVCDKNGDSQETVQFSSKSGDSFNHRLEWERLDRKITGGQSFNYYPRGRIEVKNGRIKIFASSVIVGSEEYKEAVCRAFYYNPDRKDIIWIADDSEHYSYVSEEWQGEKK